MNLRLIITISYKVYYVNFRKSKIIIDNFFENLTYLPIGILGMITYEQCVTRLCITWICNSFRSDWK
jgi:hypothetical protein